MKINIGKDLRYKLSTKRTNQPIYSKVKAEAPSSTANLGAGFDIFGLALDLFHDTVEIDLLPKGEVTVSVQGVDHDRVAKQAQKNSAGLVACTVLAAMRRRDGLSIKVTKNIPVSKGLGSSASSAVACVLALNEMFSLGLGSKEQVALAGQGEIASAGVAHYDNVAAATLGGFTIVSHEPLELVGLNPPQDLEVAVAVPDIDFPKAKTKMMRSIIPKTVDFHNVTYNVSHASLFIAGIALSNIEMMGRGMTDLIVEPVRSRAIPMFHSVSKAAIDAGASGVAISGAGPTLIALCNRTRVNTKDVANAMKESFEDGDISCQRYTTTSSNGARLIDKR
jgi:homoserine kinase